jgi:hypothetical protein
MKPFPLRRPWLALLLGLLIAVTLAAVLALQNSPAVPPAAVLSPDQVARTKHFLRSNDPRRTPPGTERHLLVPQAELELLLLHLGRHALGERAPALQLRIAAGQARLQLSQALTPSLWLNLDLGLRADDGRLRIDSLRLGRLPLPAWLAQWVAQAWLEHLSQREEVAVARGLMRRISLQPGRLELVYEWRDDSYRRLMAGLISPADQERLQAHYAGLQRWASEHVRQGVVPLVEALPPAFALARERSAQGGDAAAENRAALLSLALYATGRSPAGLLKSSADWPPAQWFPMSLQGRPDFPMHFIVSAALAAAGGGPLADALGVYKEQFDARYGSGFSFNDIAADRAGTRFGIAVMRDPEQLQQRIAAGLREQDLLPDLSDLPEYLTEGEFRQRYGAVDAPAYRQMMAAIEARLDQLALLR